VGKAVPVLQNTDTEALTKFSIARSALPLPQKLPPIAVSGSFPVVKVEVAVVGKAEPVLQYIDVDAVP
jgi:hypothetical protein